jgi:hypothetical protein
MIHQEKVEDAGDAKSRVEAGNLSRVASEGEEAKRGGNDPIRHRPMTRLPLTIPLRQTIAVGEKRKK